MNLAPVIDLLRQRIGLAPDALGATTLSRAVETRMRTLGLTVPALYAARLDVDAEEFQLLLRDVAVPETWFFRGGEVFTYIAAHVKEGVGGSRRFRILSVPCSTGEEPYSLAIALAEAGVAPDACTIEAADLSAVHIERAGRGLFGQLSFRQTAVELRDRYFRPVGETWQLDAGIRARVHFREANLLDPLFLLGEEPFDVILCRNLLIYLHPVARRQALDALIRLLALDGWLGMGHAEPLEFQDTRFTRTGPGEYFLYRRAVEAAPPAFVAIPRPAPPRREIALPPRAPAPVANAPGSPPVDLLARARQEADGGQLVEALASCQEQLTRSGPSANVYSLMGVIHQARHDRDEAVRCFRRALYLERDHAEAVAHLALLSQEQGDDAQTERLRRRLDRGKPGGET